MADVGLPNPVNPSEALLKAVRVPRNVVVDHGVGALQVDALKGALPDGLLTVVDVRWYGSSVVDLNYKDAIGRLAPRLGDDPLRLRLPYLTP